MNLKILGPILAILVFPLAASGEKASSDLTKAFLEKCVLVGIEDKSADIQIDDKIYSLSLGEPKGISFKNEKQQIQLKRIDAENAKVIVEVNGKSFPLTIDFEERATDRESFDFDLSFPAFDQKFGIYSTLTELQRETAFQQYKDKWIQSKGVIVGVSSIGGQLSVSVKHQASTLTSDVVLGFKDQDRDKLLKLQQGQILVYRGQIQQYGGAIRPHRLRNGVIVKVENMPNQASALPPLPAPSRDSRINSAEGPSGVIGNQSGEDPAEVGQISQSQNDPTQKKVEQERKKALEVTRRLEKQLRVENANESVDIIGARHVFFQIKNMSPRSLSSAKYNVVWYDTGGRVVGADAVHVTGLAKGKMKTAEAMSLNASGSVRFEIVLEDSRWD